MQGLPNTAFTKIDYDSVSGGYGYDRTLGYLCPIPGRYSVHAAVFSHWQSIIRQGDVCTGIRAELNHASTLSTSGTNNPVAPLALTRRRTAG